MCEEEQCKQSKKSTIREGKEAARARDGASCKILKNYKNPAALGQSGPGK